MTTHTAFIDGSEGTTGLQIRERLETHKKIEVIEIDPKLRKDQRARQELLNSADLAILCLPDEASRQAIEMIQNPKVRVIDASSAFRTDPNWTYGFPELSKTQADSIRTAQFVSNPGYYATGAIALLAPLVQQNIIQPQHLYSISGLSGYSGAGRKTIEICEGKTEEELPPGLQLYALGKEHKHTVEITEHAGLSRATIFSPSIVNTVRQGMLVSIPIDLSTMCKAGSAMGSTKKIHKTLADHYMGHKHVLVQPLSDEAYPNGKLSLDGLSGKDHMELYVIPYMHSNAAMLVARLDNLGKGASGAAVQNINLMLG